MGQATDSRRAHMRKKALKKGKKLQGTKTLCTGTHFDK